MKEENTKSDTAGMIDIKEVMLGFHQFLKKTYTKVSKFNPSYSLWSVTNKKTMEQ